MANTKKGFVVYFDNYPLLSGLSMEQRGLLFSALMVYADRVWRDSSVALDEVAEGFMKLTPETRMALGFMGAAVQRDTQAWLSRREYRAKRKLEASAAEAEQRAREDMERARRLMEQMDRDSL